MKFSEYLQTLNKLAKEQPELLDFMVIASIDDEGNGFNPIHFTPSIGHFDKDEREFYSDEETLSEYELKPNAICIN